MLSISFKFETKIISKENILNTYSGLDLFYRNVIDFLYTGINEQNIIFAKTLVSNYIENKDNFSDWENNAGVYIFIENRIPVYIGESSGGNSDNYNFLIRIDQETSHTNQTLPKNVMKIDNLLENNNLNIDDAINKIKQFNLIFIKTEEKGNRTKCKALEAVLIALFHPKYNK